MIAWALHGALARLLPPKHEVRLFSPEEMAVVDLMAEREARKQREVEWLRTLMAAPAREPGSVE